MPLHARSIAISMAVIIFFVITVSGCINGILPFTCCKRGLLGAVAIYIVTSLAVRIVNAILLSAATEKLVEQQQKEKSNDSEG